MNSICVFCSSSVSMSFVMSLFVVFLFIISMFFVWYNTMMTRAILVNHSGSQQWLTINENKWWPLKLDKK